MRLRHLHAPLKHRVQRVEARLQGGRLRVGGRRPRAAAEQTPEQSAHKTAEPSPALRLAAGRRDDGTEPARAIHRAGELAENAPIPCVFI